MAYDFELSDVLPASPQAIYEAWMSSEGHAAMTGAEATIDPRPGGAFEAGDGYITGKTVALDPGRRIVQTWRTSEFAGSDPAWRKIWHWGLFGGSLLPALLFGVAAGNIIRGVPITAAGEFGGDFFSLLNPYALIIGVTGLAMFIAHGSTWAVVKTEGAVRDRALKVRGVATWVFAACAVIAAAATALLVPARFSQVAASPLGWLFVVLLIAGLVWNVLSQRSGRELQAFYGSVVSVVSMVGIWAVSQFPSLLPNIDGTPGLTAFNSSSSQLALTVMLVVAGIGVPVMLAYTALVYSKFVGKVRAGAGY